MSDVVQVKPEQIRVEPRLRVLRESWLETVTASVAEQGQLELIEVSPTGSPDQPYVLTHGWIRLLAAQRLGLEVRCRVKRTSAAERRRREFDDNLLGDGLTVLDRARYLAAAKAEYELEHPETTHGGDRRSNQAAILAARTEAFEIHASRRYGRAPRTIRRLMLIGGKLDEAAVRRLADTAWADHQHALEGLAKLDPETQDRVAIVLTDPDLSAISFEAALARVLERRMPDQLDFFEVTHRRFYDRWERLPAHQRRTFAVDFLRKLPKDWIEAALSPEFSDAN